MGKRVVVAGGAGYIGSHVVIELLQNGADVLILDDFSNSHKEVLNRIAKIQSGKVTLYECDLAAPEQMTGIIDAVSSFKPDSAVHLAGLKAVGESVEQPMRYYETNIGATMTLLRALEKAKATSLVFSSSATVYGEKNANPVVEHGLTGATNPYGRTKLFIEEILKDIAQADPRWRIVNLRYFNPVGAHPSGEIGEDPNDIPNNLFPFIAQVAVGRRDALSVFGNDYPTRDGTGVRDYIHVCDLARGHVDALNYLSDADGSVCEDINLGTGVGYSVLESVAAFKRASNRDIPYKIVERREGDIAEIYANAEKAEKMLGWRAVKSLEDMCTDHWRWQSNNPHGYKDK